ncbi:MULTISPECIES: ABC-2 transporter permease [Clostridium]|uniref:ABC-2 transporter permease n=1 Tax=Clostridium TaxID=1485 RepID=UPI000B4045BA|nr:MULTISPECIES: ABC-2 transporter permease [Clostridium]NRT74875.1 ABC-type transport system involved in multi-copper enzyme maturation permease subunit [Clostridium beijerinckii]OVE66610.1 hypothetical protein CCS79_18220 [Clostridium diolis]
MFNLVLKDIIIQKKNLQNIILTVIFCMFILQFIGQTCIYVMVPYFFTNVFIISSCGYGEKNDVDRMFISLPVNRKEMIVSKYLSTIIFFIMGIAITFLFTAIDKLSGLSSINRFMNLNDITIAWIFNALYSSIYIPIYLCRGYLKSQWVSKILNYFVFICLVSITLIISFVEDGTAKESVVNFISLPNFQLIMFIIGLSFSLILILISIVISFKLYMNMDL